MFYRMRFPNDIEIRNELKTLNFYEGAKKYSKFILGKIEEYNTKVSVDFRNPKITIEHIMPQSPSESWKTELGEKFSEIHKEFLHNLGNLILTEFNSEIGNKSFKEKKIKLNTSSLNYRLSVVNKNIWNRESMLEHQQNMINWFLNTFNLPDGYKTKENWNNKINEGLVFSPVDNESIDFAEGNKPKSIEINGKIIVVKSWQDVFIQFINYLKQNDNYQFEFVFDNQNELFKKETTIVKWSVLKNMIENSIDLTARYKTFEGKVWDKVKNISDDDLFIHVNISASVSINRISNIMNKFSMDESFVKITLK
jgi:Protein of unknown function (DUF1524)